MWNSIGRLFSPGRVNAAGRGRLGLVAFGPCGRTPPAGARPWLVGVLGALAPAGGVCAANAAGWLFFLDMGGTPFAPVLPSGPVPAERPSAPDRHRPEEHA